MKENIKKIKEWLYFSDYTVYYMIKKELSQVVLVKYRREILLSITSESGIVFKLFELKR